MKILIIGGRRKLYSISLDNIYSKNKYMYYMMTNPFTRLMYDCLRVLKHSFK